MSDTMRRSQFDSLKGLVVKALLFTSLCSSVEALSIDTRDNLIAHNLIESLIQDTNRLNHRVQHVLQEKDSEHNLHRREDGSMACPVCALPVTAENSYLSIKKAKQKLYACSVEHAQLLFDSPMDYADDTLPTTTRRRQSTITYVEPKAECPFCGMSGIHEHALNFNGSQAVYACSMSEHYTRIYQQEDLQSAFSGVVAGIDAESTGNDTAVPEQQDEPFCYGSGTVMLNGFTFNMDNCITYLFDGWVLDTPFKYAGATVLTFLVTVFVQVLSKVRMKLEQAQVKSQLADQRQPRVSELLLNSSLVLVSVTFGYWVMLLTMTYSVILFLAVVFGLAVGHFLTNFFTHREITNPFSEYHTSGEAPRISSLHAVVVDTDSEEKKETYCHEDAESISDLMHDPSSPDSGKASEAVTKDSPAPKALPDTPCCPY